MALTDTAIRNAKPGEKPFLLRDEKSLYLIVTPSGSKWWRLDYRFAGKRKTLSMGVYPDVTLKAVRDKRDEVRAYTRDANRRERCRGTRPHLQSHVFTPLLHHQREDFDDPCLGSNRPIRKDLSH